MHRRGAISHFSLLISNSPSSRIHCMGDHMKRKTIQNAGRYGAALLCLAVGMTLPGRQELGQRVALVAAGLRRPAQAVSLLEEDTRPDALTTAPSAPAPFEGLGDTTAPDVPTVAPLVETPPITMVSPPANKGDGGAIATRTMKTGDRSQGIAVKNRSGQAVDIASALSNQLPLHWEDTDAPQVLILHTHTTEGYMTYEADYYNADDRHRTKDHSHNVCAVGETVRLALAAYGITAIHDTTLHDSPVYAGAYTRSAETAKAYLEQYPTIQVVLDLHRDAVAEGDTLVRPVATVEGKQAAQMMIIAGVVDTDALPHPDWEQNLTLAAHWQAALDEVSPDLMRPLNLTASRYNQHLSPGWLLVEMGAEANTVEQAVYSAQILGRTLAQLLD